MIQLFVVAGVYGFALFENREMQTRWRAFADLEAYSAAGKIHLRQQVEDQKEYAI